MPIRILAPAALALGIAALQPFPAQAAQVNIAATNPVIELGIYEQVKIEPDVATISAGVDTTAPSAVEALRQNSAEMQRVVDLVKKLGIEPHDIQTARISLSPQYDYDGQNGRSVFRGYQASNQISVNLRDIKRTGEILDALVGAGATNVWGLLSRSPTTPRPRPKPASAPWPAGRRKQWNMPGRLAMPMSACFRSARRSWLRRPRWNAAPPTRPSPLPISRRSNPDLWKPV